MARRDRARDLVSAAALGHASEAADPAVRELLSRGADVLSAFERGELGQAATMAELQSIIDAATRIRR